MKKLGRRNFIKNSSLGAAGLATSAVLPSCNTDQPKRATSGGTYMGDFAAPKLETIRMAFIGVGNRGGDHLKFAAELEGTEIVAISDLY